MKLEVDSQSHRSGQPESRFWANPVNTLVWQSFNATRGVVYPPHRHQEFNIVICLDGSVEVGQLGEAEFAEPGEAIVGNASVVHQSAYRTAQGTCRAVSLTIDPSLFDHAFSETLGRSTERGRRPLLIGKISNANIHTLAQAVSAEMQVNALSNARRLEQLAFQLLNATLRGWPLRRIEHVSSEQVQNCLPRWQLVRTHELMMGSSKVQFTVESVARKLAISTSRFHRLFRAATGSSPAQYFSRMTFDVAADRLSRTSDQVKEISYDLGFHSPSHFCSLFRQKFGVSPLAFRDRASALTASEARIQVASA